LSSDAEILKQNCSLRNRHLYLIHYITCDLVHLSNKVLTRVYPSKVVGPIGPTAIDRYRTIHISCTFELRSLGVRGCVGETTLTRDETFQ